MVKAFWRVTRVKNSSSPYDTINLKVLYPSLAKDPQQSRSGTTSSVDSTLAPFPVVIFFSGINCSLIMYQWLALKLAASGLVVVLFDWLAENIPGSIALTPGVDLAAFSPDVYGTIPSASALPVLLAELEYLQSESILAGMLDLQKIVLGGHSAGGRVALENAEPRFFSQISAAFSYGAHSATAIQLGCNPGTISPLPSSVPMLLMAGTRDGVIAKNSHRYGLSEWKTPATPVIRTFNEAISGGRNDSYLIVLEGANHFTIAEYLDLTVEATALDFPPTQPENKIRSIIGSAISLFIDTVVRQPSKASQELQQLLETNNSSIALSQFK